MCGQSGAAGSIYNAEKKAIEALMTLNIPRGPHSTGIASIPRNMKKDEIILVKDKGTPYGSGTGESPGIMSYSRYDKAINQQAKLILTHNRWATKGEVSSKNAHPFWFGEPGKSNQIIGTHNGTLWPQSHSRLVGHGVHGTDSECIFNSIYEWGLEKTVKLLEGSYAIVFYDGSDDSLNMIRNEQRPLHFVFDKRRETMFWSSDAETLGYALRFAQIDVGANKIYVLTPNSWYKWKIPESATKPFEEAKRIPLEGYTYKATASHIFSRSPGHWKGKDDDDLLGDTKSPLGNGVFKDPITETIATRAERRVKSPSWTNPRPR
jgi:glucosamine 6-phosphate synthetase-like amidotransferase/phosphosugar isomerase protein